MPELEIESDGPVWDLVAEFLERRERGDALNVEAFVHEHPEVAGRLRECLDGFQWMDSAALAGRAVSDEVLPRTFGNYELLRVIGRGGMGCVYEAMHRPLKRHVAVKVLPPHMTHVREFRLRFLREARVVASLHHTHIAPVFEVGQIGNTLYLAMPFIDGPNLRELVLMPAGERAEWQKSLRERLPELGSFEYFRWVAEIGIQTADAIAHAHGRGVIHRDVKPSNLLLDEHGDIWIVDFGLAKGPTHPTVTQPGELIGTLRYASPEQIRGEPFDERTDVYSLGVTLYEVLTRRPAFPSGGETTILMSEPMPPRQLDSRVPRDLETIVFRALAKRPQDRYASAAALADDLRRFLRDEPIRARPIGPAGRLVRWCRRNRALSAVIATAAALLAALALFDHFRLVDQRDAEARAKRTSELRYAELLEAMAERTILSGRPGRVERALDMLREAAGLRFREELWELAIRAADELDSSPGPELQGADGQFSALAWNPAGPLLVASDPAGALTFWNPPNGESWSSPGFREKLARLAWSPAANRLAGVSTKHVWLARANSTARSLDDVHAARYEPAAVAWRGDGKQLALWGATLAVWDVQQGQLLWERQSPQTDAARPARDPYQTAAWSPDGAVLVAVPRGEATLEFWGMPDGEPLPPIGVLDIGVPPSPREPPIGAVAFSPNGQIVACGAADGVIRQFQRETGAAEQAPLRGHESPVRWLAYISPSWLISADDHEVRMWDLARGTHPGVVVHNERPIASCSLDARAESLAVLDASGAARIWKLPDRDVHRVLGPEPQRITAVATSGDGRQLAWADARGQVTITELARDAARAEFASGLAGVQLAFSPGNRAIAVAGRGDPPIQIRTVGTGETRSIGRGTPAVTTMTFVGSHDRLATVHEDGQLVIWNVEAETPFATVPGQSLSAVAASSTGKWLAAGSRNGDIHLWNVASMAHTRVAAAHDGRVSRIAFRADDESLVSVSEDGRVVRWRVPQLTRELAFVGPGGPINDVAFCLDGSTLATCGSDGRVMLWAADRVARIGVLPARFTGRFDALTVTPDGRRLVAAGGPRQSTAAVPGSVEIWDLETIHHSVTAAQLPDWRKRQASDR